ncbi:hypothetical protein F5Y04DRAFT_258545 [Hypomontagnella monticulosa]|nr:hypothetical protein F5Y04DRAFT_258545 [Hypomontagnella monticulosa]
MKSIDPPPNSPWRPRFRPSVPLGTLKASARARAKAWRTTGYAACATQCRSDRVRDIYISCCYISYGNRRRVRALFVSFPIFFTLSHFWRRSGRRGTFTAPARFLSISNLSTPTPRVRATTSMLSHIPIPIPYPCCSKKRMISYPYAATLSNQNAWP